MIGYMCQECHVGPCILFKEETSLEDDGPVLCPMGFDGEDTYHDPSKFFVADINGVVKVSRRLSIHVTEIT